MLHISEICGRVGLDVEGMCREIAATLSGEWHNERKVSVRISLNDRVFEVNCSSDVTWLLSSPINAGGKIAGTLQMGRADKMPVVTGGAFLEQRQELLDNVAARLGEAVEYRNSQKELEESEARFRHLVEGVGEGIAVLDPDGSILMVNNYLVEKTGYSREELLTMKIDDCAGKPISEEDDAAWGKLDFGHYWLFEHIVRRKDGSTFPVEMNIAKISQGGRPLMLAAIRDITQRKQVEQERLQHNQDMINALKQAIQAIAVSLEMKDPYTAGHQQRVTKLATDIGREMNLSEESVEALGMAASVHDIGKMYVPSEILSKPARLTAIEFSMVKLHAQAGYDVLKNVEFPWPIAQIVLQHHERMNGSGYPQALEGADILTEARILAVADVVESMASYRPYRPSLGIEAALEEIKQNRGTLFDEAVVDACLSLFTEKGYQL